MSYEHANGGSRVDTDNPWLGIAKSPPSKPAEPKIELSQEQQDVLDWAAYDGHFPGDSSFVEAVAGSGKTFTLVKSCSVLEGPTVFTAFNKKIADEIHHKTRHLRHVKAATFHSLGLSAWRSLSPDITIDAWGKRKEMMKELDVPFHLRDAVGRLVSIGKQSVVGRKWDPADVGIWDDLVEHYGIMLRVKEGGFRDTDEEVNRRRVIHYARKGIAYSDSVGDVVIDFDDMIWLPLLHEAEFTRYDNVLVDEAQDTNAARRLLAFEMMGPNSSSMWVGDRHQAIYGFTGASSNAVDLIMSDFECLSLPLTMTFRCSKAATKFAQQWVPHIRAFDANKEGEVRHMSDSEFYDMSGTLGGGDVILCRLNRPLVSLAMSLLRDGVRCYVEGKDIGKRLLRLATKWQVKSVGALLKCLEDYRVRETAKLVEADRGYAVGALHDLVDTTVAIVKDCVTVEDVKRKIDFLFQDSTPGAQDRLVLSTVHKAKGREWDRVWILGYNEYMPSRWAKKPWEMEQERNLLYVAATRTKDALYTMDDVTREV